MAKVKKEQDDEEEDEIILFVNINGQRMPLRSIHTIKEVDEYNFDFNCNNYFILINEQPEGGKTTVFSNIKIKCLTEKQRSVILQNIEDQMKENDCEFIKV